MARLRNNFIVIQQFKQQVTLTGSLILGSGANTTPLKHRVSVSFKLLPYKANPNNSWMNLFCFWTV